MLVGVAAGSGTDGERASVRDKGNQPKVEDGPWTGTAVDDKYGVVGSVAFEIRRNGRELRKLRVSGMTADCNPSGSPSPGHGFTLPRAKIRSTGLMRGHYVFGEPGDAVLSLVSYSARFDRRKVANGRLYDDEDINELGSTCDVPPVTFSATHRGG